MTSSFAEIQADWRAVANHGEFSPQDRSLFCLKTFAPRRLPAAGPVRGPLPARLEPGTCPINTFHIDAFKGKSVTPETLIRYTFKSHLVNVLIRGFV